MGLPSPLRRGTGLLALALLGWLALAAAPAAVSAQGAKKSDAVVKATATAGKPDADGKQDVTVTLTVTKPWHIYANPVGQETLEGAQTEITIAGPGKPKLLKVEFPKGRKIEDKLVGDYSVYEGKVEVKVIVERAPGDKEPLELTAKFVACEESKDGKVGRCLLPAKVTVKVR